MCPRPPQALGLVYGELVNLVEKLTKEEVTVYEGVNPNFVPLFEIDVLELLLAPVEPASQPEQPDYMELLAHDCS